MVKYSVIIPVYNSERTLERCLDSLVGQGRKDVQIIVVNDGSIDSSEEIIQKYASQNPEIEYIYQENAGVSRARNAGLAHANGTYITFVDSDDFVSGDYFKVLDEADGSDLLVFAHENVGGLPLDETKLFSELQQMDAAEERLALLLASRKIMSPLNKRFKTDIIRNKGIRFLPNMHTGEDFNFCMAYSVCCKSIAISCEQIICVDISDQNSLSRKYRPELDKKLRIVFEQVADTIHGSPLEEQQKRQLLSITDYLYVKHVFSSISEEFKKKRLRYPGDRRRIIEICEQFRQPISNVRCNIIHSTLRAALKWKLYFPFYWVSYVVKGRKYKV